MRAIMEEAIFIPERMSITVFKFMLSNRLALWYTLFPAPNLRITNITTVSRQFHFYVQYAEVDLEGPG